MGSGIPVRCETPARTGHIPRCWLPLGMVLLAMLTGCAGQAGGGAPTGAASTEPPRLVAPGPTELEAALNAEFVRLGIDPNKASAEAPSAGNSVFDLTATAIDPDGVGPAPPTGVELVWTERLIGDYNQDGWVSLYDLKPLGVHYLAQIAYDEPHVRGGVEWWPSGDPDDSGGADPEEPPAADSGARNWRMARVDGNFDGEVNISDVTPIAQHWQERLDGYYVYRRAAGEADFVLLPDPDDAEQPLLVHRSSCYPEEMDAVDPHRPVRYRHVDPVGDFGPYEYYIVPVDAQEEEEGSMSVSVGAWSNRVPTATLEASPLAGTAPLAVEFDGGASADPDGMIVSYEWDWDGDGEYDENSAGDYAVTHVFLAGGTYGVSLRVTDDVGSTDETSITINVNEPPVAALAADVNEGPVPLLVSFNASGSVDADGAIVAYEWDLDGNGSYGTDTGTDPSASSEYEMIGTCIVSVRVTDDDGASAVAELPIITHGWEVMDVDRSGDVGGYNSMALIGGFPAMAYYESGGELRLKFIRALDTGGSEWGEPVVVDGDEEGERMGKYCRLLEVEGTAGICYVDDADHQLLYIHALDAEGTQWGQPVVLDTENTPGRHTAMAIVAGKPAAAYVAAQIGELRYIRATDASGDAWWDEPLAIEDDDYIGEIELLQIGSAPALGYQTLHYGGGMGVTYGAIKLVRAENESGTLWDTPAAILPTGGAAFDEVQFMAADGQLAVAYAREQIFYKLSQDPLGTNWTAPVVVSPVVEWYVEVSLAMWDETPVCAYSNALRDCVEFIPALDEFGSAWTETPQLVYDGVGRDVELTLLMLESGAPAIGFQDGNDNRLMFAVYR